MWEGVTTQAARIRFLSSCLLVLRTVQETEVQRNWGVSSVKVLETRYLHENVHSLSSNIFKA